MTSSAHVRSLTAALLIAAGLASFRPHSHPVVPLESLPLRTQLAAELSFKAQQQLDYTYGAGRTRVEVSIETEESETDQSKFAVGDAHPKKEISTSEITDPASLEGGHYRNSKSSRECLYDTTSTHCRQAGEHRSRVHCVVSVRSGVDPERAQALVRCLLGVDPSRGDTVLVAAAAGWNRKRISLHPDCSGREHLRIERRTCHGQPASPTRAT